MYCCINVCIANIRNIIIYIVSEVTIGMIPVNPFCVHASPKKFLSVNDCKCVVDAITRETMLNYQFANININ